MNIQRFTAPTAREALYKARMAFGDGTLILSNRPTNNGVEVMATGEEALAELDRQSGPAPAQGQPALSARQSTPVRANPKNAVLDDATQLAMSTLSFQDYVRERMLRRRQEGRTEGASPTTGKAPGAPAVATTPVVRANNSNAGSAPITLPSAPVISAPTTSNANPLSMTTSNIARELAAMKNLIEERFDTLSWLGQARQDPIQANLMLKLIRSGYSPSLARSVMEHLPEGLGAAEAMRWIMEMLAHNLRTDADSAPLQEEGGVYALVGATGVGKTTTAAKLAGLCAQTHGAASVGLITLDTYRVGAHEQLRAYGRLLGVVAHQAHDRSALQDLLGLLANKKMVLIDTTGVSPNDPRKSDLLAPLDIPGVQRLMVLNAGGHGDTLEDMVSSFKHGSVQQTVLSKTDEAAKIGPALDAVIRHQLKLRGVTTGQKVPEDWERANAVHLVALSMRSTNKSAFDPKTTDLGFFFAQANAMPAGRIHA
ncbi:MAG: flagellar biosynthesis protein FlhF [Comamonadaceae bacterium CG1_02_60_18]|nr:MAG: flagellar biosynthesis protein FlhF [Comamonadaceae bacterium CG1_02_60_18]PIQ51707.1 MAG: flagellar biosynthesis protein FlhF [Comamonadaceae bacterium CG12_big_fil_rev_8_21_14_0_65_59_15]